MRRLGMGVNLKLPFFSSVHGVSKAFQAVSGAFQEVSNPKGLNWSSRSASGAPEGSRGSQGCFRWLGAVPRGIRGSRIFKQVLDFQRPLRHLILLKRS